MLISLSSCSVKARSASTTHSILPLLDMVILISSILNACVGVLPVAGGGTPTEVGRGQGLSLGGKEGRTGPFPLEPKVIAAQEERIRLLALLTPDRRATLRIASRPPRAKVMVDGTFVGQTPVEAEIRPGHRKLEVRLSGRTPVREFLELKPGDEVKRDLDFAGPVRVSVTPPPPVKPDEEPPENVRKKKVGKRDGGVAKRQKPAPDASVVSPPPSARELLVRARKLRAAKDYRAAAATYRELIQKYPTSAEARASLVSLGLILLGPLNNPRTALRLFDRYLRLTRRGVLAQEAFYGRARALRALGRKAEEIRTIKEFLRRYPSALQADQARGRLKRLTGPSVVPGGRKKNQKNAVQTPKGSPLNR